MPLSPNSLRVAANVRAEIARKGFSQAVIAEKIGRDQHFVSRRVSGKVAFSTEDLSRIAEALDIPMDTLLSIDAKAASA